MEMLKGLPSITDFHRLIFFFYCLIVLELLGLGWSPKIIVKVNFRALL